MKVKKGFNLRNVCGEYVVVAEGKENIDFCNIISMNETSAYLWGKVSECESFTANDMASFLTEEYEVDAETALADSETLAKQWLDAGIIEG